MHEYLLLGLVGIVVVGVAAQWLAWRLRFPSILLLLIFGFVAGPVSGFLRPDRLMGELLFPTISVAVALILFEGALGLRFSEVREVRGVVRNLVSLGALVSWATAALAARLILQLDWPIAILLGAILIVTGPTVVIPLLRHVKPIARVASVARWEGIIIDPIGATMAVLVFEAVRIGEFQGATGMAVAGFARTFFLGSLIGIAGGGLIVVLLRYYWVPDFLQNPVTVAAVFVVYAGANLVQTESGLLAVTVMGLTLANQNLVLVRHIIEFKENLRVLLLSVLFILLSARLQAEDLHIVDDRALYFMLALVFLARPAAVFVSGIGSRLNWREKIFLSWMAPRGIVAAAVASVFSLRLTEAGQAQAYRLVPLTFFVIVVTVALYGLTARPLARWLGLAQDNPQGFLIVGAHSWARALAQTLNSLDLPVLLVDTNRANISAARLEGLPTYYGSILAEYAIEEVEITGIGKMLAMTSNDEANALACLHFADVFGRSQVYQLAPRARAERARGPKHLRGQILFGKDCDFDFLSRQFAGGARLKVNKLTEEFDFNDLKQLYSGSVLPLFLLTSEGEIEVINVDRPAAPREGQTLISLVKESGESARSWAERLRIK